jgi:hypothetical protein
MNQPQQARPQQVPLQNIPQTNQLSNLAAFLQLHQQQQQQQQQQYFLQNVRQS